MTFLEQSVIEHFNKHGRIITFLDQDNLVNVLGYLFEHSSEITVEGRYTTFKK